MIENDTLIEKAQKIRAIFFDVDGVLTDGGIIYDNTGNEIKRFNVKDGQIISHLKRHGFVVGAITGRDSQVVKNRCIELKLDYHEHGVGDKLATYEDAKSRFNLTDEEIAYIGDDIIDIPVLVRCGLSAAPADARDYIKKRVDLVMDTRGGEGVLRDFADLILDAQGKLQQIIQHFEQGNK